ncbi:lipid depleted protein [Culex quinquefasciatus]|uniref:Lipid depleted protein n=1 Tax=Culex quinquefasciatus TaxID=7176 RepID=B0X646_CULQU|nr:lipid depleted protein [Culex quinquefasciatus]|eukprot:XP_001865118.1 lipid depleted protein [Culex quinquefasciatus]
MDVFTKTAVVARNDVTKYCPHVEGTDDRYNPVLKPIDLLQYAVTLVPVTKKRTLCSRRICAGLNEGVISDNSDEGDTLYYKDAVSVVTDKEQFEEQLETRNRFTFRRDSGSADDISLDDFGSMINRTESAINYN